MAIKSEIKPVSMNKLVNKLIDDSKKDSVRKETEKIASVSENLSLSLLRVVMTSLVLTVTSWILTKLVTYESVTSPILAIEPVVVSGNPRLTGIKGRPKRRVFRMQQALSPEGGIALLLFSCMYALFFAFLSLSLFSFLLCLWLVR